MTEIDKEALPRPTAERWQPLRLGLVDLFYYDDEQFWFHDGRLLLRGNNGTGKSKVLALTLPFLLDGSVQARRVEPDADPKKRMDWNLLLGGAHPSSERTGYSWVEFGRVDADGSEHFTTLGIGLKAAAGRGIVKTWYFTSTRRIGDLRLLDAHRTVVSQERLRDELISTGSGQVYTTQEAYRRAVDEALFRLGVERYAALVDLLIQLRQPQLSKRPDERTLSAALTEALAPLDQAVVADVAESFRSLEEERTGIADAKDTLRAAGDFLKHYRSYAKVATRRHTTAVRTANSAYEHAGRNLREAEELLAAATAGVARIEEVKSAAGERQGTLQGEEAALRESPEMRDADRLDQSSRQAGDAERRASLASQEAAQAQAKAERERDADAEAARRLESAVAEAERQDMTAARLAAPAGLAAEHAAIRADEAAADRAVVRRKEQIRLVRTLAESARAAEERAGQRRSALDAAEGEASIRGEDAQAANAAVEAAVGAYRDRVREHAAGLTAIVLDTEVDDLADLAEEWARTQSGESPAKAVVEAAASAAQARLGLERAEAERAERLLVEELSEVHGQIATLEAGEDPDPPVAPGRNVAARANAAGAPLWRLTEFADSMPGRERANVEAALQSAGLLDAWVFPDGSLRTDGDVVLGPGGGVVAQSLADVLVAAAGPDAEVPPAAVEAVLGRIGLGESSGAAFWVDQDGRWGAGPARGSWAKDSAEHIGAGAREAHRRQRIAELRRQAASLETALVVAHERVVAADRVSAQVRDESAAYPAQTERDLVAAHAAAASAQRELERAQRLVTETRAVWEEASARATEAVGELADQAAQLSVGTTTLEIDAALEAASAYASALVELRTSAKSLSEASAARAAAAERSVEAAEALARREAEFHEMRTAAASLRARFHSLKATVGASVTELQAKLAQVTAGLGVVKAELTQITTDQINAAANEARLEEKSGELGVRREETAAAREERIESLRVFAATGLLRVAVPDLVVPDSDLSEEWNLTAALGLSRAAEQQLDGTDESDDAWARAQQRVSSASTELTSQMSRHGHTAFVEQHGDVLVARVRYLNEEVDVDRLADRLEADVADRERLLSAREREILENHLVNEVAGHLHELLLTAEGQIDRMNRELAERRTSTGMQLRVRWRERADGPVGLASARDLMLRSDATWTPADRAAIGDFLQARIGEVRDNDPSAGWQEHLEQALDYRQWHSFAVERWQNGQWRSASGPASGGEKALSVSVPLFAAASAHYNSAGPHAPRLILLDEAFAGVDDDSRAKSLGLLATFDLDVVMTSEREWGCYPQVPGLAIAQLSRVEGVDAVGVSRWRWDGRRRQRIGEITAAARAGGDGIAPDDVDLFG